MFWLESASVCVSVFAHMHVHTYMWVYIESIKRGCVYLFATKSSQEGGHNFFLAYRLAHGGILSTVSSWFAQKAAVPVSYIHCADRRPQKPLSLLKPRVLLGPPLTRAHTCSHTAATLARSLSCGYYFNLSPEGHEH